MKNKKELKGRVPDLEDQIFNNMSTRTFIRGVILDYKKMSPSSSWILYEGKPRPWTKESNRCSKEKRGTGIYVGI